MPRQTFASKLMDYCLGSISKTRLTNCNNMIAKNQGGKYTVLQVITMKAELKTLRKRVVKEKPELLDYFDSLFGDIVNFELPSCSNKQLGETHENVDSGNQGPQQG